jgi:hypothetical protein
MAVTAVKSQAKAVPAEAAGAQAVEPPPPAAPSRRRGITPLTPMRQDAAKSMSRLADRMQKSGPDILAHQHVRDAARMLRAGQEEAAQRHLRAAMFSLTPQSLHRNGIHHDDGHTSAREAMHAVHRHLLLVKDITDVAAKNQEALRRDSYGDDSTSNPPPRSPVQADPNAGCGPGALAQKPTARQPPGNQAMNAPARSSSGGSDPAAADPVGPQPRGSKQFARTWSELAAVIDLVGPRGFEHGWHYVGGPGLPSPAAKKGAVKAPRVPMVTVGKSPGPGAPRGILSGPHPANRLTVASDPKATARVMSDDDLQRADVELSRRATLLGKPGQKSRAHKAVVAEMQRRGTALACTWGDLAAVVELASRPKVVDLVGPHGYIHGWIFVGVPAAGAEVYHPGHGRGTVTASGGGRVQVAFDAGRSKTFPVRSKQGSGHFEQMTDDELADEYARSQGSRAGAIVGELDRRDQRDQEAKAQRVKGLYAEQPKTEADRNRVYQGLVNEGEDPEEAWSHAYSTSAETMQKQSVMQDLRAQGYKGAGFDALTRAAYKDEIRRRVVSAENATNGYMLTPQGKRAGIDPWSLFTGPESRARKYASPELKEWWDQNGRPTAADFQAQLMGQKLGARPADFYASVTWDDHLRVIEMSARTAQLERTPAPYGKPGGPGLYGIAGNKHSDYFEQIVKALMEKRGMDKGRASAIAWGVLRKWAHGGGGVHPEVAAAASRALAGEAAASAKAHAHAVSWDQVSGDIELATVLEFFNPDQLRVAAGNTGGGQFAPAGGAGGQAASQQGTQKGKAPAKQPAKPAPTKHQLHVAHVAHQMKVSTQKAELLVTAQNDKAKASALIKQRNALAKALASAGGKVSSGQAGAKTATTAKTKTTAPASKTASTGTTASAKTATASSAPKKTTTAAKSPSATAAAPKAGSAAAVKAQIAQLNLQINSLLQAAAQASAQAAKMQ